ncbi:MAG TPA: carbohydrate kinase family protein [Gemmatimonadales bacterium]|nr:carbohydrate kinase family protein [Gemmatimonadales bacterium]
MRKLGVLGSLVWDEIHGRDPAAAPVEEWGGIAYALAGLDASLAPGWEIVPLIKVGRDLSAEAAGFLRSLERLAPGARCVEVPVANNRVVLRYESRERRCERMSGGVPGWTWPELGPMVRDLDALYVNFISGFELCLGTAQALRQGFRGPIYGDVHSLFLGMRQDGVRVLQPLPDAPSWWGCFDVVQMNEDEMGQLGADPLLVAADVLATGASLLVVTLGARGALYVTDRRTDAWADGRTDGWRDGPLDRGTIRTAIVPAPATESLDPTGCGDVFGATLCARLLAGDGVEAAVREANRLAARNAAYRGATGLARYLRGELVTA